ncbi:glycine cleavage system aminomethyltransferase GcvT [Vagococcus intermedius]|uniref:Aminomethyltransferase n=1 Tax=Vagococcus intermedius TaxID=2991418 RepID=A0AAF0CTI4_9ENTE|nr:glycine cleavage system aminomethyltransferase GcvT [Vagococcus intermedius]WEG72680.1 glycine cleavage system aminomethyltransferase GcvT [Vagococcus intermedius]WEG74765.1 glycine cleavage system aminomethyltransferase GcvT [Vagococcus intermedius]
MKEKTTALYEEHLALGGKMVPFAEYLLPINYQGTTLVQEHLAVREQAGLFDVSHMGTLDISGEDALDNLNYLLTNDFSNMTIGQVRYSLMLNNQGGILDDFVVFKWSETHYQIIVNAANRLKDYKWLKENAFGNCKVKDLSEGTAILALQGPNSTAILEKLVEKKMLPTGYYRFIADVPLEEATVTISQTGYTGEMGYELYCEPEEVVTVWRALLEQGKDLGLVPCGLGARDTLRLEAGMPLYGHELSEEITPFEAGLKFAVKMTKPDFIGKGALESKLDPHRLRRGLKVLGKGLIREDMAVHAADMEVGYTTSGTFSPSLGYGIGMALLNRDYAKIGTELIVNVRGRHLPVEVVSATFYKQGK